MSDKEVCGNESSDEYECPVDECDYSSDSERGVKTHFGQIHNDDTKREVYLGELQRLADEIGRTPRQKDMLNEGMFRPLAYRRFFGSWNNGIEAIGHDPNKLHTLSRDVLIKELQRLANELGCTPRAEDMDKHGKHSHKAYKNTFGSWNGAVEEAGLKPNAYRQVSREELLNELYRLADKLGRVPKYEDMNATGEYSGGQYGREFGSWNAALELAGFYPHRISTVSDSELLDEIRRLKDELRRTPRAADMIEHGKYGHSIYSTRFGTWLNALEEAGFKRHEHSDWVLSGEEHPNYTGGAFPYGPGWNEYKKEFVRDRDGRECQHCGRSEEEHIDICGLKQSVHHIQKARTFDDWKWRNDADNLVTLCIVPPEGGDRPCHSVWEDMSPLRPHISPTESDG